MKQIFNANKPVIGCIHLKALPGAPLYDGNMVDVIESAINELQILEKAGFHGVVVENFRDMPFYPDKLPPETIASLAVVCREIVNASTIPVGVNALRNDAISAVAVATACGAHFVRINIHMHAYVTDQGILEGQSYKTLRLKKTLMSNVRIFADVSVKHAVHLSDYDTNQEIFDLIERGLVDALIITGLATGDEVDLEFLKKIRSLISFPLIVGSGIKPENLGLFLDVADAFIVGSWLKKDGNAFNAIDEKRVKEFMRQYKRTISDII